MVPFLPPTRSSKLRLVGLFCIARGPVGRSVLRAFAGPWPVGDGERAEVERFWEVGDAVEREREDETVGSKGGALVRGAFNGRRDRSGWVDGLLSGAGADGGAGTGTGVDVAVSGSGMPLAALANNQSVKLESRGIQSAKRKRWQRGMHQNPSQSLQHRSEIYTISTCSFFLQSSSSKVI